VSALLYIVAAGIAFALARRVMPLSWRAAAVLLLVPLGFAGRAMFTGRIFAPIDLAYMSEPMTSVAPLAGVEHLANPVLSDVAAQFIPWNVALRKAVGRGEWPLWNPYEFCGDPLAGAAQSAPYHPVTLLGLLVPLADGLTFTAAITLFLAALTMFLFLRDVGCDEGPALFGAAAWAMSTHLFAFLLTAHGLTIAVAPIAFLGAQRVVRDPSIRSAAILVVALTLSTLAGHPETELHVVAIASAYALCAVRWTERRARTVIVAIGAGIVTLLLCAIHLGPLLEALPQTREFLHRASGAATRTSFAATAHLLRANLFPMIDDQGWTSTSYAGALLLAPALAAILTARKNIGRIFFGALLVFALLVGARMPGLYEAVGHLPLFSIAVNERLIEFATFALCVLGAIGLQRNEKVAVAALIVVALVAATANNRIAAAHELLPLLLLIPLAWRAPRVLVAGALALLLIERGAEMHDFIPTVDRRAADPPIARLHELARADEPFRIVGKGTMLTPNLATLFDLEDVRGYQAMTLARMAATFPSWSTPQPVWFNRVDNLSAPLLSVMNVRYAIVAPKDPTPTGWRDAGPLPGARLIENLHAMPRAFAQSGGTVSTRGRGGTLTLHASLPRPGWIVVSEPAWRGWRVTSGEKTLHTEMAYGMFVSFYLPQGESDVVMRYRPRGFVYGAAISAITALALLAFAVTRRSPARP